MVFIRLYKEMVEFLESMNSSQFKEIEKFFETMPKLSQIKLKNPNTKVESDVLLEGLASFRLGMAHMDLMSYYKLNFSLMQYHKYSLTEIENMIPWERDVYIILLKNHLEEKLKAEPMPTRPDTIKMMRSKLQSLLGWICLCFLKIKLKS